MKLKLYISISVLVLIFVALVTIYLAGIKAPTNFPTGLVYTVSRGTGMTVLANNLQSQNLIRSPFWFKVFSVLSGGTKGTKSGDYNFSGRQNTIQVALRISSGEFGLVPVKVTIPEGISNKEIATLLQKQLQKFDIQKFLLLSAGKEGYLFPDTYFFLPNQDPEVVIKTMSDTFTKRLETATAEIEKSGKSLNDIIIMASIIEEEGKSAKDRMTISGILWKRLAKGMPLQVDAPFRYSVGKDSYTLTSEDLKIDGPYNTYTRKGLPPTPITNPGLESILAAIRPVTTPYYFFLSEKDGTTHYATTYDGHLQNKQIYLE